MFEIKYDAIVCGGGLAGCAAAYRIAQQGFDVLLIERYGFLGGMATAGKVSPWMRYWSGKEYSDNKVINKGFFELIRNKLLETNDLVRNVTFNDEMLKIVLQELLLSVNVKILHHAFLVDAKCDKSRVMSITVATKGGLKELSAKYFIDATGDGDLANYAGFDSFLGREEDHLCQPMTLCFRITNAINLTCKEEEVDFRNRATAIYRKCLEKGELLNPRENVLVNSNLLPNTIHFNSTRILKKSAIDPIALSEAEIEGKKQVKELFLLLKKEIPELNKCILTEIAPQIGIRESRRIKGNHIVSENELLACKKFSDSIARGNYCIDVHNPSGAGTVIKNIPDNDYYTIPYAACVPENSKNLLVVGRPISSTHVAHSAFRIMPITTCIGDGVGLCLTQLISEKKEPAEVNIHKVHREMDKMNMLY